MQARTIDTRINGIVNEHLDALSNRLATTTFPETYRAMLSLYGRTNSLKAAALDTLESGNTYASRTLQRCLCEHYLRFLYIWVRFTLEKSDAAAADYYRFCDTQVVEEGLDILTVAAPLVSTTALRDYRALIAAHSTNFGILGGDARAHQADHFRCRSIVELLARDDSGLSPDELPLLDRVIPTLVLLAPFARGGPDMEVDRLRAPELDTLQVSVDDEEFVVALPASVFMLTALAISREYPEHQDIAPTICALIERSAFEGAGQT